MPPHGYEDEDALPDEEAVIEEFLGENPRARDLRLMRTALEQRAAMFRRERARVTDEKERAGLDTKVAELEKQIAAIRQEEAITTFVEDSVRVTLHRPSLADLEED
jgi:hypothetical protein